jgi:hypothetical protein
VVAYAVGAWALLLPLGLVDGSRIPAEVASGCGCSDNGQQVWLLAVAHARLAAGHLPFFTNAINYPSGVNLMDTAGFPLLAAAVSPITGLIGPIETYNLLLRVSLLVSATACFLVLRRLRLGLVAAGVGGAVYAFSPYLVRETEAHLFIVFAPLPPVILLILYRRLRGDVERPFVGGLLVGLLLAVQALISVEVAATTALVVGIVLALVAIGRLARHLPLRQSIERLVRILAGAALVAVPLLAYPVWYQLKGPQHIHGAPSPPGAFALSPLTTLFPNGGTILAGRWSGWGVAGQGFTSTFDFIGIPMLLVVAWLIARHRHHPLVIPSVLLGAVSWVLTLGPRIRIGHGSGELRIPLPFAILDHLPLLQSIVPNRLALFLDLSLAVLAAVALDRLLDRQIQRRSVSVAGTAAVLASVALLMPAAGVPVAGVAGAERFRSPAARRAVPAHAIVIAYPYPRFGWDEAMLWQAESGLRYSLIGGYAERPLAPVDLPSNRYLGAGHDHVGDGTKAPATLTPRPISRLLLHAQTVGRPLERRAETALPAFTLDHRITTAMVLARAPGATKVIRAFTVVFGPPTRLGPVLIWSRLRPMRARPGGGGS